MRSHLHLFDDCKDCAKDSTDPEITRRRYHCIYPEWFVPNVRLRLQNFLPRKFSLVTHETEISVLFQTQNDKTEVCTFIRRLFQEHNALVRGKKNRVLYTETAYIFCMDTTENSISTNFFLYIPKYYYRRYLEDVPVLLNSKMCLIIDYSRALAFRLGIRVSKLTDETDGLGENTGGSIIESSIDQSAAVRLNKWRAAAELPEGRSCTIAETIATNRAIQAKRIDQRH